MNKWIYAINCKSEIKLLRDLFFFWKPGLWEVECQIVVVISFFIAIDIEFE